MLLIGQLDSPYVRRVAISAGYMGFIFERKNLSVFRDMPEFSSYNPVLKSPSFVTDDGTILMDSSLIIQYLESRKEKARSLIPQDDSLALDLRIVGLALAASDKSVQIEYEEKRPENERSQSWTDRIYEQMLSAFSLLEQQYQKNSTPWLHGNDIMQGDIATIIALTFAYNHQAELIKSQNYTALDALRAKAEALDIFQQYPYC